MKKKQFVQLGVTLGLVAAVGVGGTLAALTAKTNVVTNTFTVGNNITKDNIRLDEAKMQNLTGGGEAQRVTDDGNWDYAPVVNYTQEGNRVLENKYIGLQPKDDIFKDPTVTLEGEFADCYVFINVNGLQKFADTYGITVDNTNNHLGKEWKKVNSADGKGLDGIYYYSEGSASENTNYAVLTTNTMDKSLEIFESLNVADNEQVFTDGLANDSIQIVACAVQATNVETEEAVNALPKEFTNSTAVTE